MPALDSLRVVDASEGIPGAYAARLLTDAGAEVVRAPLVHDPLREWWAGRAPRPGDGALYQFLRRGQTVLPVDHADRFASLCSTADIVIVGPDVDRSRATRPATTQVVVAITPYGMHGPWADQPASDLVLQAESGGLATRGRKDRPPFMAGGRTNDWISGAYAAAGALAAWRTARRSGEGQIVDVSMLEVAHISSASYSPLSYLMAGRPPITEPARTIESVEVHPTADGWVGFTTNSAQQFRDFLVLIGRTDLLEDADLASAAGRQHRLREWLQIVDGWTSKRATHEIVEAAGELRVPCAPVGSAEQVFEFEHFRSRGVFCELAGGTYRFPRRPWLVDGDAPVITEAPVDATTEVPRRRERARAVDIGDATGLPLADLRVVDLTAWWAGPTGTHLLGCLGADVVHVESITRLDGMRMTGGVFRALGTWWERSSFFLSVNSNKRGLTLDLNTEDGIDALRALIERSDILVENFTPRVLDNLGLTRERLHEWNPALITVRMPAFGLDGPWRDRPGFAQTMEQLSGLAWLTGFADDQPHNQRGPCDPNGGVHAAFAALCALETRAATGRGCVVEIPFIEVALNAAAEQLVEFSAGGEVLQRDGNRAPTAAPQGVYACRGVEQWLALSIESDDQWAVLVDLLGGPAWATPSTIADRAGRRRAHDMIDARLGEWLQSRDVDEVARELRAAGIPAGRVLDPRLAGAHEQYVDRRFFETLEHPVVGRLPFVTQPFRLSSVDHWLRTPAPTVGQHNSEILAELGYPPERIAALEQAGVIGTRPVGL
jgi:crotonobetainyl-CoA:carnitine CoA-transferase CaiB-like acyl-CoA transferase